MTKYIVTASALTVREGPGLTFKAVGYLKETDIVEVLAANEDDSWKKIQTPADLIGWCASQYLTPVGFPPPPLGTYTIQSLALFIRQQPVKNNRVIGFGKRGEIVEALESSTSGEWMKIRNKKNLTGWCLSKYLSSYKKSSEPEYGMHQLGKYRIDIYQTPGQTSEKIGKAAADYLVNATEESPDKMWKKITTHLGVTGWCQVDHLICLGEIGKRLQDEEFPWMPIAFGEIGIREYPGSKHNIRIQEYFKSTVLDKDPNISDETHWCAAYVNWCVEKAGIESNNSPVATAWTRWGQALDKPRRGCIVTFKWDDGGSHVAFYLGENGSKVYALGGNQSDGVWIMSYPKKNVTTYRIPKNWE